MSLDKVDFGNAFFTFMNEFETMNRTLCKKSNLHPGQPRILTSLVFEDGISLKKLSENTGLSTSSLSVSVRNLEKKQLIKRKKDMTNNTTLIYLTNTGKEHALDFHYLIHEYFVKIESGFPSIDHDFYEKFFFDLYQITKEYHQFVQ